uniref:helix-turn-helix transcriptional regulator n=1 Tax=uncultured Halomonas sp. TaxID=173971 RepID=UPI00262B8279|nr:substrate-binding domain-containing protein [uncultured Halomonas sp.]
MKRIRITPAWRFSDEAGNQLDPKLFVLLEAVHRHGKLTRAAETAGISYRHAWNLLHRWGDFFGVDLVELERGRGARLSPLGEKLLWAEQRVSARLGPQLESLGSELNLAIQQALEGVQPVLRLHASHGYAVELLPEYLEGLRLDLQYCSPREALAALNRGACDLAGFHLPRGKVGSKVSRSYRDLLKPRSHRLIGFITRQQGLIVAPGNPKGVHGMEELAGGAIRFINRQAASGTRALLDGLLVEADIQPALIQGYEVEEYTHSAVAAYVAAEMADVGFGVEAAARRFGLDFVPLVQEDYLLVCHHRSLKESRFERLFEVLGSEEFQLMVETLPGYAPSQCGRVMSLEESGLYMGVKS